MTNCSTIMAIIQDNRVETAVKVQDVLTRYGCYIRVRLGLHDAAVDSCTNTGIILLQLCGENVPTKQIEEELKQIPNVKVKYMTLDW
ncbi:hypothetical protein [Sporomusa acidovorans]|uniref:Iron-only hydrogenase system regulator n=1 Tax=Sporomusa acidovorans (strain ATCC 49682 / DSM 3132 / Mol) TaxID=1123286 RepID=A0ABZ3J574_SPOA4|nr:hypothetical protein [Sporomusa acidovorans]OZC16403.1 hypothetical protein SPACI_43010 [Sporomusa acidovorans DSM 3132]SDE99714.1 hypothetical protein SAMN04488499_102916 [Sporomusa acidovorans]